MVGQGTAGGIVDFYNNFLNVYEPQGEGIFPPVPSLCGHALF
jgi:hypothetical protein